MVTWKPVYPLSADKTLAADECELAVTVAPLRCIIDQRAIKFAQVFFHNEKDARQDWTCDLNLVPGPYVRSLRVKPLKLKIDYTPQKIDTDALRDGSIVELINLSPLDSMVLTLREVDINNVKEIGDAVAATDGHAQSEVFRLHGKGNSNADESSRYGQGKTNLFHEV